MGGPLFDPAGINKGVTTGDTPQLFGDQTIRVISAAITDVNGTPFLADNITAREITDLLSLNVEDIVDNGDDTYTVTKTDGTSFNIQASSGTNNDPRLFVQDTQPTTELVDGAIWINTSGIANPTLHIYNAAAGAFNQLTGTTNLNSVENLNTVVIESSSGTDATIPSATTVSSGVMSAADKGRLDGIPLLVANSNLPRLTEDLVADREYVIWVTNNTGANTNAIDRTAVDIQGQDASTLIGTTVSITAGRTIPLYVSWNSTTVGDIQNNATLVDPTVTFTSPNVSIRAATGEDVSTTYALSREFNDGTSDQATIQLTEGTSTAAGMVHIRGQNEITVGESATDANTILIDYQVIPPIHPENLSISVSPTHLIEVPTGNISLNATVTLRETGTNWRISGITQPTASRPGVSFGVTTGIGTQSVSIPVTITQDDTNMPLATSGNISLSFRVSGNNGLPTTDPDYQAYRSVVRNVNITVNPVWYAAVLATAPTTLSEFGDQRGVFRIGAQETLTGIEDGVIYVAIPSEAVDERIRFTTSNPNIFYEFTTRSPIGDFSIFNLGTAVAGTYVVRIGGI